MWFKRFISLLLILTTFQVVHGQLYVPQGYHEKDGLPSNIVPGIAQGPKGLLWFLTDQGLCSYDGISWEIMHNLATPKGWSARLHNFPDQSMIITGFERKNFKILFYEKEWKEIDFNLSDEYRKWYDLALTQGFSKDGKYKKFAFNTKGYIHEYDLLNSKWTTFKIPEEVDNLQTMSYVNDTLYFTTSHVIYYHTSGEKEFKKLKVFPPKTHFIHVYKVANSPRVYIVGNGWIGLLVDDEIKVIADFSDPTFLQTSNITDDGMGNLYFTSSDWFYRFNTKTHEFLKFRLEDSNAVPLHSRIFFDNEKNFWVNSYRGAYKVNSFSFTSYNKFSGLIENEGTSIFEVEEGKIMAGGISGYSIIDTKNDTIEAYDLSQQIDRRYIHRFFDIKKTKNNETYVVGGVLGLGKLNSDHKITWRKFPEIPEVVAIYPWGDSMYIANQHSLFLLHENKLSRITSIPAYTRQITTLPDGRLCLLTSEGLFTLEKDQLKPYYYNHEASSNFYVLKQIDGHLYVGSHLGLLEFKNDSIIQGEINGFKIDRPIYDILETRTGHVWVGTDNGVSLIKDNSITQYTPEEGLIGNEINRNSLFEDSKGRVWIGSNDGVSCFDPLMDLPPINPQSVEVLKISNKNTILDQDDLSDLSYKKNDLEFHYRAISFSDEKSVNYRIRLKGLESEWRYLKYPQTSVLYTFLPYGQKYQLEIQARVKQGPWSPSAFSTEVSINQPFYSSWWFIVACLLVSIGIGYLIQYNVNQVQNNLFLKKTVAEKTAEIAASREILREQNKKLLEEIEERKKAEAERSKLIEELTKINKELDWFIYSASHDLSAPIKSLDGLMNIMAREQIEEPGAQYLSLMKKSLSKLEVFINELIDFSRNARTKVTKEEIVIKPFVTEIIDNFKFYKNYPSITFSIETGEEAESILSDPFRIRVIMTNLISNAINYHDTSKEAPFVTIKTSKVENKVLIKVSDNGHGIPSKMIPNIFNMFFRATDKSKGSGLGLYIVKEAMEKIHGKIHVQSQLEEGTTFTLELPVD
ncbi:sensor histidine kinase [Fulvivirga ligni]|uniref:sensor histidine kinase n=1 Tax=Fulvivirga ligni TaxID=2904246 RepID=UPI001F24083F|nr:HAMP domain-containing sensor histidine kinase [Fulvivirga ligni]UII21980.1 ATP-binding protein [Fulvivirga ligni]